MRIDRWSEPRFIFVCQLVEVIREADANEISGELGLALPVSNIVCGTGGVGGELQELHAQFLIRRYSTAF